jgi:hypothetical protein
MEDAAVGTVLQQEKKLIFGGYFFWWSLVGVDWLGWGLTARGML